MNSNLIYSPRLSIIATGRNDDHGGNLIHRMQLFVDGILEQTAKFQLKTELILVEWNPPDDKSKLKEALTWPEAHEFCVIRIIEVPNHIHSRFEYAKSLSLYQMIAKNAGIRRATGQFVLVTNIDILFSNELFRFMASGELSEGKLYRVARYDVNNSLLLQNSLEEKLNYCENNIIRINSRYGSKNLVTGEYYDINIKDIEDSETQFKPPLFTNACGDFQLMSNIDWHRIKGYAELDIFSMHIDSLLQYMAYYSGMEEIELDNSMKIYHIEHTAGWTPEAEKDKRLENRLKKAKISSLRFDEFSILVLKMLLDKTYDINFEINNDSWGLSAEELPEETVNDVIKISTSRQAEINLPNFTFSCDTKFWLEAIEKLRIPMLSLHSSSFSEWIEKLKQFNKSTTVSFLYDALQTTNNYERKKIIIFGTGSSYQYFIKPILKYYDITPAYFVDNDPLKLDQTIDGLNIKSMDSIRNEDKDNLLIIIASQFYPEIKMRLDRIQLLEDIHYVGVVYKMKKLL